MEGTFHFGKLVWRCNAVSDTPVIPAENDQISSCSLGLQGASLRSTAWATTPRSSTVDIVVLGQISLMKRLEHKIVPPMSICFNLAIHLYAFGVKRLYYVPHCVATKPFPLHRNINMGAMPTPDIVLHHLKTNVAQRDKQLCTLSLGLFGTVCSCKISSCTHWSACMYSSWHHIG